MTSEERTISDPYQGPPWWIRLLVFLGLNWTAGYIALVLSPGGGVQSVQGWMETMLIMPVYAPGCAAFAVGGILHSVVALCLALVACYVGSLFLVYFYFAARTIEGWVLYFSLVVVQLVLALIGLSIFTSNMSAWT